MLKASQVTPSEQTHAGSLQKGQKKREQRREEFTGRRHEKFYRGHVDRPRRGGAEPHADKHGPSGRLGSLRLAAATEASLGA